MFRKPDESSREMDDLVGGKMNVMRGISIPPYGK